MPGKCEISLILPAYNEVRRIAQAVQEAAKYFQDHGRDSEIIVSVSGDDGTREVVENLDKDYPTLKFTSCPQRLGKGHAVRCGVKLAEGEIIGYMDADGKTPIQEFAKFEPMLKDGHDLVIGSRRLPGSLVECPQCLHRRLLGRSCVMLVHALLGLHDIADTQCGFKFLRRQAALDLFSRQRVDGFMFDAEILYLARKLGYRIAQIPIRWKDDGDSRLNFVRDNLRNLVDILRIRSAHARPGPRERR